MLYVKKPTGSYNTYIDLSNLLNYVFDYGKMFTDIEGSQNVLSDDIESIATSFFEVRAKFGIASGCFAYHIIVSFDSTFCDLEILKVITNRFAEMIGCNFQAAYAAHENTENLHIHYVINPISYRDGRKMKMSRSLLLMFRNYLILLENYFKTYLGAEETILAQQINAQIFEFEEMLKQEMTCQLQANTVRSVQKYGQEETTK